MATITWPLHGWAEVLYDFAAQQADEDLLELTVLPTGQKQFSDLVEDYLKRINYGDDGWSPNSSFPRTSTLG